MMIRRGTLAEDTLLMIAIGTMSDVLRLAAMATDVDVVDAVHLQGGAALACV